MPRRDQVRTGLVESQVVAEDDPHLEDIVDEVEYALFPPKHEGKLPTYGGIIAGKPTAEATISTSLLKVPVDLARQMADGVSSFAIRSRGKLEQIALFTSAHDEELQLIELASRWKGIVVHRTSRDVVRVFTGTAIHIYEAGQWLVRPYAQTVMPDVSKVAPQVEVTVLRGLLIFAFHSLSPSNVGATLVWWLENVNSLPPGGKDLSKLGLDAGNRTHMPALRSLLRNHDGAVFLSPIGHILSLGHHLKYSDRATELIPKTGGTRHTSARRFSFDEAGVIVITVSEDGPVSVFSDGVKVTELDQSTPGGTAQSLANLAPEKRHDLETFLTPVTCGKCGKTLEVEVVIIYGWREPETGECPVCGTTVYEKNCWKIIPRLVKKLRDPPKAPPAPPQAPASHHPQPPKPLKAKKNPVKK
jgi:hypothetical protein